MAKLSIQSIQASRGQAYTLVTEATILNYILRLLDVALKPTRLKKIILSGRTFQAPKRLPLSHSKEQRLGLSVGEVKIFITQQSCLRTK